MAVVRYGEGICVRLPDAKVANLQEIGTKAYALRDADLPMPQRPRGPRAAVNSAITWVAVKELKLSYYIGETL